MQPSRAAPSGGPPTLMPCPGVTVPTPTSLGLCAVTRQLRHASFERSAPDDAHAPGPTPVLPKSQEHAQTQGRHTDAGKRCQAHACIPVQRSHVPLHAPASGVTCWQVCVWKHTLLQNPTPLTSGAHRGSQPGPAQAPLPRPTRTHLQMGSAAAGAGGTGSSRNRGSSRWWWRPRPRRGSRQRRCLLWSWDLDKEQVPSPSKLKGGILTTLTVTLGSDPWPAGGHHKPRCGSPGGAVPDRCG